MAYLGQRKLSDAAPNHPWARTQIGLDQQQTQNLKPVSAPQNHPSNFDVAQGMIDGYNSLTPDEQAMARKMGF